MCHKRRGKKSTGMKTAQFTVEGGKHGATLQDFVAERLDISRKKAKDLLDARNVFVNARRVWMARHALSRGDQVEILVAPAASPAARRLRILHEDPDYLVADKPPGMLSNGPDSAESLLRTQLVKSGILAVHRLDRDTSGCLLLATSRAAFDAAIPLFRGHRVKKTYHAIAAGRIAAPAQTVRIPVDGERAVTHLRLLDACGEASHLLVSIETGRTHQIRKHLDAIGHPLLGDRQYGTNAPATERTLTVPRQMLHAYSIQFSPPTQSRGVQAVAPLPPDFRACLRKFKLT